MKTLFTIFLVLIFAIYNSIMLVPQTSNYFVLYVILMGLLGSFTHWLLEAYSRHNYDVNMDFLARLTLGAIASYLWYIIGLPDSLNYFLVGYFAISFIKNITRHFERGV